MSIYKRYRPNKEAWYWEMKFSLDEDNSKELWIAARELWSLLTTTTSDEVLEPKMTVNGTVIMEDGPHNVIGPVSEWGVQLNSFKIKRIEVDNSSAFEDDSFVTVPLVRGSFTVGGYFQNDPEEWIIRLLLKQANGLATIFYS